MDTLEAIASCVHSGLEIVGKVFIRKEPKGDTLIFLKTQRLTSQYKTDRKLEQLRRLFGKTTKIVYYTLTLFVQTIKFLQRFYEPELFFNKTLEQSLRLKLFI